MIRISEVNVGAILRQIRHEKGMTQKEFARVLGISKSYLGDIEQNRRNHFTDTVQKICESLDMTVDEFKNIDIKGESK